MNVTKRRRSIYFTEDDSDLLEYVNQKDIAFNRYLMRLIREDMERDGDISNKQLLLELKELFPTFMMTPSVALPVLQSTTETSTTLSPLEEEFDDIDGL